MRGKIQPHKLHASRSWSQQPGKHLDGRGFARAVWPEETEKLARSNLKVDAVHGSEVPEFAGQLLRANGNFRHSFSLRKASTGDGKL